MIRNIQSIPLSLLKLDQENVRFGSDIAQNQREAIELIMSDPEDARKILKLAEHISLYGLDPTENQLVTPDGEGNYIVLEGNRRLTALKLLQKPDLCPVERLVKNFFDARNNIIGEFPEEFQCSVVSSREEGDKWVELKHTGQNAGIGRVNWDSDIRDERRARQTGVESVGRQVRKLIKENDEHFSIEAIAGVAKIPVTTLTRLFSSAPAQNTFQLKIEDKVLKPRLDMVYIAPSVEFAIDMFVSSGYNVNDIRSDDDRKAFVARIPNEILPLTLHEQSRGDNPVQGKAGDSSSSDSAQGGAAKQARGGTGEDTTSPASKKRAKPSTQARKYLMPWSLSIDHSRINEIYRELRSKLEVEKCPNAVAVTFRVFIEITCDHFTETQQSKNTPVLRADNRAPLKVGSGTPLSVKVQAVCAHLLDQKKLSNAESRTISRRASAQNTVGSIDHFNFFVHDSASQPIPSELKAVADEYRPFFEAIWS